MGDDLRRWRKELRREERAGASTGEAAIQMLKGLEGKALYRAWTDDTCQKRGVAYPRLPYLRRGETMLFDVCVPLVIRPEVTTNG